MTFGLASNCVTKHVLFVSVVTSNFPKHKTVVGRTKVNTLNFASLALTYYMDTQMQSVDSQELRFSIPI